MGCVAVGRLLIKTTTVAKLRSLCPIKSSIVERPSFVSLALAYLRRACYTTRWSEEDVCRNVRVHGSRERTADGRDARPANELMADPEKGAVIRGCGGLRKIRAGAGPRGKGKRGGTRVIYLSIPEAERIDLLTVYGKDEKKTLARPEKRVFL